MTLFSKLIQKRPGVILLLSVAFFLALDLGVAKEVEPLNPSFPDKLPARLDGRLVTPDLGGFWTYETEGDDYKSQLDAIAFTGSFDALTLTLRQQDSLLNNQAAHDVTKKAVEYGRRFGIGALLDVDLRIARYDFEKERPDLALERLFFEELEIGDEEKVETVLGAPVLEDHYTGNLPYYVRGARVVKAWAFKKTDDDEIDPDSICDVTSLANWDKTQYLVDKEGQEVDDYSFGELVVSFDREQILAKGDRVVVAVAFRYAYPDLFADETLELQKKIYENYRDMPAYGVCKDEWGFLPIFDRGNMLNDFWFSDAACSKYAKKYDGRELIDDLFLAFSEQAGREAERRNVVDMYRKFCSDQVLEYELQSYATAKEIWGKDAFVGVHPTWYAWPNVLEMRKNGIMWWKTPRDFAQTDEYAPFCARNSMAKGTCSQWINMFYFANVSPYIWEHWTAAASGGRVHIHQIYPYEDDPTNRLDRGPKLYPIVGDGGVSKIRQKIRMLNLVSNSQIDSPVAVIFSRFGAANPLRPEFDVVGWDVCDRFSTQGYPADLIPIDEMSSRTVDGKDKWSISDGYLTYGAQKYQALLLYGESESEKEEYEKLHSLARSIDKCKTQLVSLEPQASDEEIDEVVEQTVDLLEKRSIVKQTPWVVDEYQFAEGVDFERSTRPPRTCVSRFIDGTILWIAAEKNDFGDPIKLTKDVLPLPDKKTTPEIAVEANGVFAVRFDQDGKLNAFVASELKTLHIANFDVDFSDEEISDDPVDVAVWLDSNNKWRGVFQRNKNDLPKSLEQLDVTWNYLQRR